MKKNKRPNYFRPSLFEHIATTWPAYATTWPAYATVAAAAVVLHVYLDNELHYTTPNRVIVGGQDNRQVNAIKAMGLKDVNLGGHDLFKCKQDDSFSESYEFSATNLAGEHVHGVVCCGLTEALSSCTVRF